MPRPNKRSRTLRRVFVRTPGGTNKILYKKRKPRSPHCANCGKPLHGTIRAITSVLRNVSKSKKHPKRKFGGNLCFNCTKRRLIQESRR